MEGYDLYYRGIYLGSLFEDGVFEYVIDSADSDKMDVELVVHQLELIREVAKEPNFDYKKYIKDFNNFSFDNGFKFVKQL